MIDSIVPFFFAHCILFLGLTYVPPLSPKRIFLLLLIICCCLVSARSTIAKSIPGFIGTEYTVGFIFHASFFMCLAKLEPSRTWPPAARRSWGINQLFSARWGVTHIPAFKKSDRSYVPTQSGLFLWRLWDLTWTCGVIWLFSSVLIFETTPDDFSSVPNGFIRRIGDMDSEEVVTRVYLSLVGYLVHYCTLRAFHSLVSCIGLLCGQDAKDWPPLFDSISEAYTLRRYYSHFWHHLMRKAWTSHAVAFSTKVLRLPKNSQITRYTVLVITFMTAALMHILASPGRELCSTYPYARYYTSLILAVTLEDLVLKAVRVLRKQRVESAPQQNGKSAVTTAIAYPNHQTSDEGPGTFLRMLGYTWVLCFHIWAGSKVLYGLYSYCA